MTLPALLKAKDEVTGSVAALDAVPKAISWAGQMAFQNSRILMGVRYRTTRPMTPAACNARPTSTTNMYNPKAPKT